MPRMKNREKRKNPILGLQNSQSRNGIQAKHNKKSGNWQFHAQSAIPAGHPRFIAFSKCRS
jgi:hypothetical protein